MLELRKLYLKSAKHWKKQILVYKQLGYVPIQFCPFCAECNGECVSCRVSKKICISPMSNKDTLIHEIQINNTSEKGLKLAKKLRRKLIRKALLW